jgi:hypothetical protein
MANPMGINAKEGIVYCLTGTRSRARNIDYESQKVNARHTLAAGPWDKGQRKRDRKREREREKTTVREGTPLGWSPFSPPAAAAAIPSIPKLVASMG